MLCVPTPDASNDSPVCYPNIVSFLGSGTDSTCMQRLVGLLIPQLPQAARNLQRMSSQ